MLVEDLLHHNPLRLISAAPEDSASAAAQRMAHYNIGFVVVIDDNNNIAGVLSERDIIKGLAMNEANIENIVVADLMTTAVISVAPTDDLVEAVRIMNSHGIRHLLVVQAAKPVGVLSVRDLLRVVAQQFAEPDKVDNSEIDADLAKALAAG